MDVAPVTERPTYYLLTSALRDALLGYLAQRPFVEVSEGIRLLEALQPAVIAPPGEDQERATA